LHGVTHADEFDAIQLEAIMKLLHGADAIFVLHRCAKQTTWTKILGGPCKLKINSFVILYVATVDWNISLVKF
jgi:hypothetical protein